MVNEYRCTPVYLNPRIRGAPSGTDASLCNPCAQNARRVRRPKAGVSGGLNQAPVRRPKAGVSGGLKASGYQRFGKRCCGSRKPLGFRPQGFRLHDFRPQDFRPRGHWVTLTVIVEQSPSIVRWRSSPTCSVSRCWPGGQLHVDDVLAVAEMHPRRRARDGRPRRQAIGVDADVMMTEAGRVSVTVPAGTAAIWKFSAPNSR